MKSIGIDIGTTSISAVVLDCETESQITSKTIPNDTVVPGEKWEHVQDVEKIYEKVVKLLMEFCRTWKDICVIGLTGQMHGMVYLDQNGEAISNLVTWEDERGNLEYKDGRTYAEYLTDTTGYFMSTGFGITTLFFDTVQGKIPEGAEKIATVMDYVAMKLCDRSTPVTHSSNAASFGLYDLKKGCFDKAAAEKAGIAPSFLPEVLAEETMIGTYADTIPVMIPIGDNQAGVYALINSDEDVLVNIGTSSQISTVCQKADSAAGLECRPYVEGKYIALHAGLCGGVSFALLNEFFCQVCMEFSEEVSKDEMYEKMMYSAWKALDREKSLSVRTQFRGTRKDPSLRGSIGNIGVHNFTPGNLVLGFYRGVCEELLEAYEQMKIDSEKGKLVLAGNAFRKNELLRQIISDLFGREAICTDQREEAATGAAKLAYSKCRKDI